MALAWGRVQLTSIPEWLRRAHSREDRLDLEDLVGRGGSCRRERGGVVREWVFVSVWLLLRGVGRHPVSVLYYLRPPLQNRRSRRLLEARVVGLAQILAVEERVARLT